ncbi:MAG: hypothetical protein WA821_05005 [Anaerolineales bacterium]
MQTKKAGIALLSTLCAVFMVGCIPSPPADLATPSLQAVLPTVATPTMTETQPPVTSTPEPLKEFDAATACVSVETQVPQGFDLKGGLFLYDPSRERSHDVVLMDLSSRSVSEFAQTGQILIDLRISPNGAWVAYQAVNKNNYSDARLVIKNFATNATLEIPWKPAWDLSGLMKWLNGQELLIRLQSYTYPYPLIAFNPFTQSSTDLPATFPNQEVLPPGTYVSPAEYDPSLNYVVYSAKQNDMNGFALFDRAASAQIAFFPSQILVESGSPAWSHDGQKFVFASKMVGSDSFINVGRPDGSVTPIVNLSRLMGSFTMRSLTWSPDDKFVAVDIYDVRQETEKLLLLDLNGQKVLDPCIKIEYDLWPGDYSASRSPTWSPDSQYLIVEEQFGEGKNKVALIDVAQMQAGILAQDQRIAGWVSLTP